MTGAMYAAISGMKTHMNKLNVIGNNVANVNTFGYKTARTTFSEAIYSTVTSGSNGSNTSGGINPAQLGYGCNIGTIDLDMASGPFVPTGKATDLMINGDGFFFVGPKPGMTAADGAAYDPNANHAYTGTDAQSLSLTRVGNFKFDSEGYLTDGNGMVVYGFVTCVDGKTADPGANVDKNNPTVSTQLVPIRLPLARKEAAGDALAGSAVFPGVNDTTGRNVYDRGGADGITTGKAIKAESISIDGETGQITVVNTADNAKVVVGYIPLAKVANPNGVSHEQGPYYRAGDGAGESTIAIIGEVLGSNVYLDNAEADADGATQLFSAGETTITPRGLEGSSTDIATEFSEMISTQRGYQANTRIITVTDAMLEELVNIKR